MKFSLISPLPLSFITNFFFFLIAALTSEAVYDEYYTKCNQKFECGSNKDIKYPFYKKGSPSYCGILDYEITCQENIMVYEISSQWFVVRNINRAKLTMEITRKDLYENICTIDDKYKDAFMSSPLVSIDSSAKNITIFYSCPSDVIDNLDPREKFSCRDGHDVVVLLEGERCEKDLTVPVMSENLVMFYNGTLSLPDLVKAGVVVHYDQLHEDMSKCYICEKSGGICGTNATVQFTCFCKHGPQESSCPKKRKSSPQTYIVIVFSALAGFCLIAALVCIVFRCRNKKGNPISSLWESRNISSYGSSLLDLEKSDSYYGVQVFDYKDLQEATNNFDEKKELGDGGFGVVYKGKLQDGRVVAVKRLYEHNFKRVEQFMNEVEILAGLRHKNLVTLYGCTSRDCRELLLVYEYVSNGTVADHLHGERAKPGALSWTTRINIAVETANALYFLHKKDVIHRDVKTNNILLDNNFCVKVADFGLSRLYPTNVTHVSTAPQGTPGYVDPEYHQCYRLTDKSDVYSFGVVLIELISSMPAVDITRHRHDINLSTMALDKIQNHALHEIVDPNLGFDSDFKIKNMINGVAELAFRCLQNGREMRPSMGEVLEILKMIKSEDHSLNIIEEIEIPGSGDTLSRSDPPAPSPSSTISNSTNPNSSS